MYTLLQASVINPQWRGAVVLLGLVAGGMTVLGLLINYIIVMNLKPSYEGRAAPSKDIRRYSRRAIILHGTYAASFIILLVTGIVLFIPGQTQIPSDSLFFKIHIAAGIAIVALPLLYALANPSSTIKGLKNAVTWGKEDLDWIKGAPLFYYLFDERAMPPQGYLNTFQKMWLLMIIASGIVLAASGVLLGFWGDTVPADVALYALFAHDIAFIAVGAMFIVHVYLTVIHPMSYPLAGGGWSAITRGTVSSEYARIHHSKWYDEIIRGGDKGK